ncbi:hypothetical protein Gorai_014520, partial [Gossypium raimondii]|nr:hypothetical protein [Gossypium raimondii]
MALYKGKEYTEGNNIEQPQELSNTYTRLWGLNIPNKIRIHFWKIINESMPTLWVLKSQKLVVNTLCPVCQVEQESVAHLFRDCDFLKQVLEGIGVVSSTSNIDQNWKQRLVEEVLNNSITGFRLLAISYWALWYNRNKIYHEEIREQVHE